MIEPSFAFAWPWAALLLPLPLLLPWLWPPATREADPELAGLGVSLLHPRLDHLEAAFGARRRGLPRRSWLPRILLVLLWTALVLALMQPQRLSPYTEVSTPGYDLMLAVDASHSMEALDFSAQGRQVNRMQVVKGVMSRFIERREGDRVGLIVFGSRAYVLSPLTLDRRAVNQLLATLVPSVAGPATALGDAIALGVAKLRERPPESRVMVLIADGDNNAGSFGPLEAARLAAASEVRIYVIGVGSSETRIPILEGGAVRYRDDLTMDESTLETIATLTGGAYFRATDTRALEAISALVDRLEKSQSEQRTAYLPEPLYRWPLGAALSILLWLGIFPNGRFRIPRRLSRA